MGYPNPLKPALRKIADNVVTVSCPFSIKDKVDIGGRMSLINFNGSIVIYSPIPYGGYMDDALKLLTGKKANEAKVTHLFIVNRQHNLAAKSFRAAYPDIKIIAGYNVDLGEDCPIDYRFTKELGNRILTGGDFRSELAINEPWVDQVEVVFLRYHKNNDVVLFYKDSKILFEGDVVFNLGTCDENGCVEQYSPDTGYPEKHYPFTGWSFLMRYFHPKGYFGPWISSRLTKANTPEGLEGVKLIDSLNFEVIVPCHGNVISKDAKNIFRECFKL